MSIYDDALSAIKSGNAYFTKGLQYNPSDPSEDVYGDVLVVNGQPVRNTNDFAISPVYETKFTGNSFYNDNSGGMEAETIQVLTGYRIRERSNDNIFRDTNISTNPQGQPVGISNQYESGQNNSFLSQLGELARGPLSPVLAAAGSQLIGGSGLFGGAGSAAGAAGAFDAATLADLQLGQAMTANAAGAAGGAGSGASSLLNSPLGELPQQFPNAPQTPLSPYNPIAQNLPSFASPLASTALGSIPSASTGSDITNLPNQIQNSLSSVSPSLLSTGASVAKGLLGGAGGIDNTTLSNLISGGMSAAGQVIQSEADKAAQLKAQQDIINATQTGVTGSQFRPVGITTAFGSSNFKTDPVTGQLISAGYTPSSAISQGVSSLTGLGQKYLAQSPEDVANQYMLGQQNLLAPTRERQLAAIRNQLQNTGRTGLSIGGTGLRPGGGMGLSASNPELEAYYNAIAQQDATLAANAQTAGQQNVNFGAGLFTQAGGLEQLAQQPLSLGASLGGQAAQYGANAGRLGVAGTQIGANFGTGSAATNNPYASVLTGLGSPTSTLSSGLTNFLGNYLDSNSSNNFTNTLPTSGSGAYSTYTDQNSPDYLGNKYTNPAYWT